MIRELTPVLANIAVKELHEDPEKIAYNLQHLKNWISKQNLKINSADQWLMAFLRGSKYNIEQCKAKLIMYHKSESLLPELFCNKDPFDKNIQEILKSGVYLPLIKNSEDDLTRKILIRYGAANGPFLLTDLIKVTLMIAEILMLEDDNFTVAGEVVIVDMTNMGWSLHSQWTPVFAKKIVNFAEHAFPVRIKGIHIFNLSGAFQIVIYILKLFIGKKLKERLLVYGKGSGDIKKNMPTSVLPTEYGGTGDHLEEIIVYWKNKVESYRDWFLKQDPANSEECQRPGF